MAEKLQDGLYLHLPEETYFSQGRMGSSDWAKLFLHKEGWWWASDFNPQRVDSTTRAKDFGSALHANVLEGESVFLERYAQAPSKGDYPGLCVTSDDIRERLEGEGFQPKKSATKTELREMVTMMLPEVPVWDAILAAFEASIGDRCALPADDYRSVQIMADSLRAHPEIGPLLQFTPEHIPLAEISVLYHDEHGIACRDRIDLMIPQCNVDLKSILGSFSGKELKFAVPEQLVRYAYFTQIATHHRARKWAYRYIIEGKVHGATDAEMAWLKRFPAEAPDWGYLHLFVSKPDAKEGKAPISFPWWHDYGDELHRLGLRALAEAQGTYRRCMAEWGPDKPWTRSEPLHVTDENSPDRVFMPHWTPALSILPNEEELLA